MSNETEQPSPQEETPLLDQEGDSSDEKQSKPNLPVAYIFFRVHTLVTVISLALISAAQYLPPPHHRPLFFTYLIHFYMAFMTGIGVLVEVDWVWFINKFVPMLKNWIIRGFCYVFIALFAVEESTFAHFTPKRKANAPPPPPASDAIATKKFFHSFGARLASMILWVGGIALLVTGALYILMGLLFLEKLKKKSEEDYDKRKNEANGVENEGDDEGA
mmetsp:Transcript_15808/g.20062  ORF Transcript_15808/g.20062 Transcript_15808/m.20062 type:complete len:218 (-) Transcript_15808:133-786(-)|eukprot:CAMPEP_0203681400 /NCGR_PEP_ID=MMETSP0090-20130426/42612_1 /ASSEMBLY_ACC=CAM_ASM_001088 /TAXON_ID=426623 /ORGANISM="Chaetoceros affinis, Strain CCMP159" /LENGTH=217 /DNA_ID=CAMNT_0050549869 /DNA_START=175 /DNA_END=828 /DNA_ORIENTATION=-